VPAVTELIIAEMLYLQHKDRNKPMYLYINSTGGRAANAAFAHLSRCAVTAALRCAVLWLLRCGIVDCCAVGLLRCGIAALRSFLGQAGQRRGQRRCCAVLT
jgi:hypothetical protein